MPSSDVAMGRRMKGSETLMARFPLRLAGGPPSWRRLRRGSGARRRRCGAGLPLLVAFALRAAFAPALTPLALLALPGLAVAALAFPFPGLAVLARLARTAAATLARRQVGRGHLIVVADRHLRAVGQVGKARRHHAIGRRQAAGDNRIVFVLLRHGDRLRGDGTVLAD